MNRSLIVCTLMLLLSGCISTTGTTTTTPASPTASICATVANLSSLPLLPPNVQAALQAIELLCASTNGGTVLTQGQATKITNNAAVLRGAGVIN